MRECVRGCVIFCRFLSLYTCMRFAVVELVNSERYGETDLEFVNNMMKPITRAEVRSGAQLFVSR